MTPLPPGADPAGPDGTTYTDAVLLAGLPVQPSASLWDLATDALVVDATTTCAELDGRLRTSAPHEHSSVVVLDRARGAVGSVQRQRFEHALSGPFGFGRALLARRTVAQLTDFDTRVVPGDAGVGTALEVVLERPRERRADDLVLRGGDGWRVLPVAVLMEAAAGRMAWHASRDPLTGLVNRGAFFSHLERIVASVPPADVDAGSRVGVVFVDLDRLKTVNDTLGHTAGDALIRSVARRLRSAARPQDVVARLGGDEFAIACLVPGRDDEQAARALHALAERHLEVALDRWVLRTALEQLARWLPLRGRGAGVPPLVNVNLSPASLGTPDLADRVLAQVRAAGCAPGHLRLELPETASLSTLECAVPQLDALARAGVALVVDDMGAGASSLRNLSTIPVAGMKIDRSFVAGMLTRSGDRAVVQMLTDLAVGLGLRVTAEGVETAAQEEELRRLGVSALQGFHLGRPVPAEAVVAGVPAPRAGEHR